MAKKKVLVGEAGPEKLVRDPAPHPAPVEGAVVPDPLAVVAHESSKADVAIRVPKTAGAYGLMEGGRQVVHDVALDDEGGLVMVHPDHAANFLRAVEGSKLAKPRQLSADEEAVEASRPVGRVTLAPLTDEELAAAQEQIKAAAGAEKAQEKAAAVLAKASKASPSKK